MAWPCDRLASGEESNGYESIGASLKDLLADPTDAPLDVENDYWDRKQEWENSPGIDPDVVRTDTIRPDGQVCRGVLDPCESRFMRVEFGVNRKMDRQREVNPTDPRHARTPSTRVAFYPLSLLGMILLLALLACGEAGPATPTAGISTVPTGTTQTGSPCPEIPLPIPNSAAVRLLQVEAFACSNNYDCATPAVLDVPIYAGGEAKTGANGRLTLQSSTTIFQLEMSATLQLKGVGNFIELFLLKLGRLLVQHDPCGPDIIHVDAGKVKVEAVDTYFYVERGEKETRVAVREGQVIITATLSGGTNDYIVLNEMQGVDISDEGSAIPTPSKLTDQDLEYFADVRAYWDNIGEATPTILTLPTGQTATEVPTVTMTPPQAVPTDTAESPLTSTPIPTDTAVETSTDTPEQTLPVPTIEDTVTPPPPSSTPEPTLEIEPTGLIAFASDRGGGEQSQIYVMNADGSDQHALTKSRVYNLYPDWSPNGRWIVFIASDLDNPNSPGGTLHIIDAIKGSEVVDLKGIGLGHAKWPKWSPDGRYLVYSDAPTNTPKSYDIYLLEISPNGRELGPVKVPQIIARSPGFDGFPAWGNATGNDYIFFTSERSNIGESQIFAIRPDGSNLIRLTSAPGDQNYPAVSRDGKRLAFTSTRGDQAKIYTLDLTVGTDGLKEITTDRDAAKSLTSGQGRDLYPTWSPEGRWVAFHSNRDDPSNYEIYLVSASPGASEQSIPIRRLTDNPASDDEPTWQP